MYKNVLQNSALRYEVYHPESSRFSVALKSLCKKTADWGKSCAWISLQFPDQMHIVNEHNMQWFDNKSKLVYVRLQAVVHSYVIDQDREESEIL